MNISQFLTKLKTLVYSKNEVDTKLSAVVHTSGAEDISGNKNFIDNLTRGGKNVEAIEEQGDGYIRYSSGIQICWGYANALMQYGSPMSYWVYPKSFNSVPKVACTVDNSGYYWVSVANVKTGMLDFAAYRSDGAGAPTLAVDFIVIGRWK